MEATASQALDFNLSKEATQRLLRDWKEVQKEPIHTVTAKPLEDKLREWHCNLIPDEGPYQGTAFHLVLDFPANYPNCPPNVRVCTYLSHPNVFDDYICLDMIKEPEWYARPYEGWSTAYSVQSVLLQLQSFLFAENVPQDYGGMDVNRPACREINRAKREAASFCCSGCGFRGSEHGSEARSTVSQSRNTVVHNGRHAPRARYPDHSVEEGSARGGVHPPRPPSQRGRGSRSPAPPRPAPGTVNELILRALGRSARAASPSTSDDASSDGGRVAPMEELESPTRGPVQPTDSAQSSPKPSPRMPAKAPGNRTVTPANPQREAKSPPQPERAPRAPAAQNPQTLADRLSELPTDVLVEVMDRLDGPGLSALVRASRRFARAAAERGAWVRRELQCFHSKRSFGEEVLGFGIATKGAEDSSREYSYGCNCWLCRMDREERAPPKTPKTRGRWEGVLTMDYLSAGAFFEENVRRGVWNERLEWWLPLLLDDQHSARALPLLKGTIAALAANPRRPALPRDQILRQPFYALNTLKVLPRLMNSMVVSFMKQESAENKVDLHASEKALLGYCQLHHMLLRLAQEYPVLQAAIDRAVSRFQSSRSARHKNETPDLGELLVLLSVAKTGGVTWDSLAPAFMAETFDRNVLWLLREHPELAHEEAAASASPHRLATTFDETATSRRLIMFQVAFLLLVRPPGASVSDILADYAQRYGYPRPGLTRELQKTWYRVRQVATWPAFFAQLGLPCPSPPELCAMLRQAVVSSNAKGYHSIERLRPALGWSGLAQLRYRKERAVRLRPGVTSWEITGPDRQVETRGPFSSANWGRNQPSPSTNRPKRASLKRTSEPSQADVLSSNPFTILNSIIND